jgi:hypothetical protein
MHQGVCGGLLWPLRKKTVMRLFKQAGAHLEK